MERVNEIFSKVDSILFGSDLTVGEILTILQALSNKVNGMKISTEVKNNEGEDGTKL